MLNNLNEWQDIIRDKTSPSLSIIEGSVATVPFGTNSFSSGLVAFDDGEDISYDIIAQEGFDTFIPDGVTLVSFTVTDKGGNSETLSREVSIIGGWSESTISFYDFTQISGLPQNFLPQNGEWEISDEGLKPIGEMPDSPRWVITSDVDANCDFQVSYTANGAGNLLGLVYRFVDVQNFSWVYLKDGELAVRERINGADIAIASSFVSNFSADEEYIVGLTAKDKDLSVYVNGELKITTESEANTFSRKFGILLVNGDSLITKAQFSKPHTLTHGIFAMNQPPTANAGPDQSVAAATQFTLDGTGSQDTDGTIVEWRWTQTAGDTVTLNLDDPARPTAKSPSKTTAQRLTFQLVTVDDEGAESSPGTVNIDVAAFAVSEMLKLLDTRQWTVVNDGSVQAFEGRSNREAFRFQVTPSDGIQTSAEGYFLFDQPGVHAVEVISTPTSKISSVDDPYMIRGDVIAARIGDLQTDENGNLTLTFVLYVTDDKDGLVMTAKVIEPYQKASYFRKQG